MVFANRLLRNKCKKWLRDINAEHNLLAEDLILPVFITEGNNIKQEIKFMPGIFKISIDNLLLIAKEAKESNIKALMIFPSIEEHLKDTEGSEAYNNNNLSCRAIKAIKNSVNDIGVIADIALDPYTSHGHDGILFNGQIDNNKTVEKLVKQSLTLAAAGVDALAPSDMMDNRVIAIRSALDNLGYDNINIFSYSAKYASNFYTPFREAINIAKNKYLSKMTYQLDIKNSKEAIKKAIYDTNEGADAIIVKPAIFSLDIIHKIHNTININTWAYQISGEYAMLKFTAMEGVLKWQDAMIESLICIKRAGASCIITYAALEVAKYLNDNR
ncbi:porphobilinogen synthase [Rickettsia endosymbiont of Cardiosporidium cionae]|uniref:porphobilinogen synthase n=1 Tax=Rickettsia endosymbiont of Cardiosporidium cionae TaxID=2777155 RepID=UPI001E47CB90|nr:porphobilinogen synthase [Rickettsia endosymbiont of Cardiosporidium cionae]KAF8818720.1 porphobilinogen synthase [Rickettsia endosymbiont of Cardiosporidium cionae]